MDKHLSIVIPTKNSPPSLMKLLESISSQVISELLEVIIVHNLKETFSEQKYEKFQDKFKAFHYICSDQLGVNTARNIGMSMVSTPLVWFIDDDCLLQNKNIAKLVIEKHLNHPYVTGIGGCYLLPVGKKNIFTIVYHSIAEHWLINSVDVSGNQTCLVGGNASYKINEIGHIFDEYIVFGGSEVSFNWKLILENKTLILDRDLDIEHRNSLDLVTFSTRAFLQGRGQIHNLKFEPLLELKSKHNVALLFTSYLERWTYALYKYFFFLGVFDTRNRKNRKPFFFKTMIDAFLEVVGNKIFGNFFVKLYWALMKPIYNFSSHVWKIKKPLYIIHLNFWKIKKPLYIIHINFWKIKILFYFIAKNFWRLKLPFYKIYFVFLYHVKTYLFLGFLKNKKIKD